MSIKYAVFPGYVTSKNDGDRHYIDAEKLIKLYGVDRSECVIMRDERGYIKNSLIELRPRCNGNYEIIGG